MKETFEHKYAIGDTVCDDSGVELQITGIVYMKEMQSDSTYLSTVNYFAKKNGSNGYIYAEKELYKSKEANEH